MKKILLVIAFTLLPYQAHAGGIYDGIWQLPFDIYATINQNGNSLAIILLEGEIWEAQLGTLSGNEATVVTVLGYVNLSARIVFHSTTSATITILSCTDTPSGTCLFPAGTQLSAVKVF